MLLKGTDFYMTSLNAQALINEWNNGMNLVEILETLLPQVSFLPHSKTTSLLRLVGDTRGIFFESGERAGQSRTLSWFRWVRSSISF